MADKSTALGAAVKSGWLLKRGAKVKSWHRRWFVLDDRAVLRYFRDDSLRDLLGVIDLKAAAGITLAEVNSEPWSSVTLPGSCSLDGAFAIELKHRIYYLHAAPNSAARKWTETLLRHGAAAKAADPASSDLADDQEMHTPGPLAVEDSALHYGWLTKQGAKVKSWRRRFFALSKNGMLIYAKGPNNLHKPCGEVDVRYVLRLKRGTEMDDTDKAALPKGVRLDCSFALHTSRRHFTVYADTSTEAAVWFDKLEAAALYSSLQASFNTVRLDDEPELQSEVGLIEETAADGWDADDDGEAEATEVGSVIVEDAVSPLSPPPTGQQREYDPLRVASKAAALSSVPRGPRSVSAILDPSLYDDLPDLDGLPPADPSLFPMLQQALEQEINRLSEMEDAAPLTRGRLQSFTAAARLGATRSSTSEPQRQVLVIYNPVAGTGQGGRVALEFLAPILRLAKVKHAIMATEYAGHATEMVSATNVDELDGIVLCGGDGLLAETLTGLVAQGQATVARMKIGVVPVGNANTLAMEVDGGVSTRADDLVHRAALAVALGHSRKIDVMQVLQQPLIERPSELEVTPGVTVLRPLDAPRVQYAVSCLAWGLAGACSSRSERLRWAPGEARLRYDLAGFLALCAEWPLACPCTLSYRTSDSDAWVEEQINIINFVATNQERLGGVQRISRDIKLDDGRLCLAIMDDSCSRSEAVMAALALKQGAYLVEHPGVRTLYVTEFAIEPKSGTRAALIPMNIDGDAVPPCRVNVKVLHHGLTIYAHHPSK